MNTLANALLVASGSVLAYYAILFLLSLVRKFHQKAVWAYGNQKGYALTVLVVFLDILFWSALAFKLAE